ncbi:MAG: universal stress protein [Actinomycetales bacterium]
MSILVAASASPEGEAALREAVAEAARRQTTLLWCNLGQRPIPESGALLAAVDARELPIEADQDPADALIDLAAAHEVELLVVGTRRRSPVGKLILGSVAQRLILDSPVPVLTVKAPHP